MKSSASPSACARHRGLCILCLVLASLPSLAGAETQARAREPMFDSVQPAARERSRSADRPAGLREFLSPREMREESVPVRRKLSSEERNALRRDLRDAMRGAYPEVPRRDKN